MTGTRRWRGLVFLLRLSAVSVICFGVIPFLAWIVLGPGAAGDDGAFVSWMLGGGSLLLLIQVVGAGFVVVFPITLAYVREFAAPRPLGDVVAGVCTVVIVAIFVAFGPAWPNRAALFGVLVLSGSVFAILASLACWRLAGRPKPPYTRTPAPTDEAAPG